MNIVVIDTSVFVAAVRSSEGDSRQVLRLALRREIVPVFGNALFAEYEDLLGRDSMFATGGLSRREGEELLDALASVSRWVSIWFLWRPNLPDPGDDHLIELAVAAGASTIITSNVRDVARGELVFGALSVKTPARYLQERTPMSTLTIRLQDEQHERLRALAKQRGVSLNKLFEEFTARAIAEFDTETRFRARAERGDAAQGLAILDALDRHHDV